MNDMTASRTLFTRRVGLVVAVLAMGAATACRPAGQVRAVDMTPLPTPEEALATVQQIGGARRTLRAAGRLTYYGDKGRVRVRMEVVAERPGRFRVATISPFDQPIDVMTCDGEQLWLLSKGALKRGPATASNVARLLPLPLTPDEVVDTLLGGIPTGPGFTAEALTRGDNGAWRLVLVRSGGTERAVLTYDPSRKVVVAATLERPAGTTVVSVSFEDFEPVAEGELYPERIKMQLPGQDTDIRIKLKRPELNASIDGAIFRMQPPPGQDVLPL